MNWRWLNQIFATTQIRRWLRIDYASPFSYLEKTPDTVSITCQANTILSLDAAGMTLQDASGKRYYVDFDVCQHQWIDYINASPDYEATNAEPIRCIAARDVNSNPMYFHFYSTPPIRLEFPYMWSQSQARKALMDLRWRMEKLGWITQDLT
jgi:hypothetical protein